MFAVEVIHQSVDDGEVEQVQVEPALRVRVDRTSYPLTVRTIVEPVLRPTERKSTTDRNFKKSTNMYIQQISKSE